jgi:hypothetical protein
MKASQIASILTSQCLLPIYSARSLALFLDSSVEFLVQRKAVVNIRFTISYGEVGMKKSSSTILHNYFKIFL